MFGAARRSSFHQSGGSLSRAAALTLPFIAGLYPISISLPHRQLNVNRLGRDFGKKFPQIAQMLLTPFDTYAKLLLVL